MKFRVFQVVRVVANRALGSDTVIIFRAALIFIIIRFVFDAVYRIAINDFKFAFRRFCFSIAVSFFSRFFCFVSGFRNDARSLSGLFFPVAGAKNAVPNKTVATRARLINEGEYFIEPL